MVFISIGGKSLVQFCGDKTDSGVAEPRGAGREAVREIPMAAARATIGIANRQTIRWYTSADGGAVEKCPCRRFLGR